MNQDLTQEALRNPPIIACIWDFDKTLIKGYMQKPLFKHFDIDEKAFWKEVNLLPSIYAKQGIRVSAESVYLNHILSYVKNGPMRGLSNSMLREFGKELEFCNGIIQLFEDLKELVKAPQYAKLDIKLEHYIVSTGLAEMIRGSAIAPHCDGIFACEFIEEPLPPYFSQQPEFDLNCLSKQINQIGFIVDNTIKTRFIFEINKGTNKNANIDVNSNIKGEDRRVPIKNMIYVADGPSDVPVFSVVKKGGGKTYAVYDKDSLAEFEQNDMLLASGRIDAYGAADYAEPSSTHNWLKMHVRKICDRITADKSFAVCARVGKAPEHIHPVVPEL